MLAVMKGGSENCGRRLLPILGVLYSTRCRSVGSSAVGLLTRDASFNFASN